MKKCTKCGVNKPFGEFCKRNNSKDGLTGQCKDCLNRKHQKYRDRNREDVRKSSREWGRRNSEHVKENLRAWRKESTFAVSLQNSRQSARRRGYMPCIAGIEEIETAFTGRCDICDIPEARCESRLHLDHDHETGEFRGWLCGKCNRMLGLANDSVEVLMNAFEYIMNQVKLE